MTMDWTPLTLAFLRDAGEYHPDYYQLLAQRILLYVKDRRHVCDVGCGAGGLSLALAGSCRHVTAIDRAPLPLELLRQEACRRGVENLTVCCGDAGELQPHPPYSAMIFCQFGDALTALRLARRLCSGTAVIVTRSGEDRQFALQPAPPDRDHKRGCARILEEYGIPYRSQILTAEFGQPFRSVQDAAAFFRLYNVGAAVSEEAVEKLLHLTGRQDYPLYFPKQKRLGIFAVRTGDIPNRIEKAPQTGAC
ncbi:MAG: class I SAM-dependent methyltransferase [Faecousia sp.]